MDVRDCQAFTDKEGPGSEGLLERVESPLDTGNITRVQLFDRMMYMRFRERG